MTIPITLSNENGGIRIQATYKLDYEGVVSINVHVPLVNPSMLELQAVACEQASESLAKWAATLRRLIPKDNTSQ
jgi:hypothetical protein